MNNWLEHEDFFKKNTGKRSNRRKTTRFESRVLREWRKRHPNGYRPETEAE